MSGVLVWIGLCIICSWVVILCLLLYFDISEDKRMPDGIRPAVSILIALRNEENQVYRLCESLRTLSYPADQLQILLGDDDSSDHTFQLLMRYKPARAQVFSYSKEHTGRHGKQKVLSQLVMHATGEYLLFTDADMTFPTRWVETMLAGTHDHELRAGFTRVSGDGWLDKMQNMDWLFHEYVVAWFAKRNFFITAWGNNMMISSENYNLCGGYSKMEETVVEDIALTYSHLKAGGTFRVNPRPEAVATTDPEPDWRSLWHQRKRWMKGLSVVHPLIVLGSLVKILSWPAGLYLMHLDLRWGLIMLLPWVVKMAIFRRMEVITKDRFRLHHHLYFEIYDFAFYFFTFVSLLLPLKFDWKGRTYR